MSRRIKSKQNIKKPQINYENIENFFALNKLDDKTQMIRNICSLNKEYRFTDRRVHTEFVANVAKLIYSTKFQNECEIDLNRLVCSALLHDVGHTPFGHACEDEINNQFSSNDKLHYSSTVPGLFKHNLNSVKLIKEYFSISSKEHILIDSVLKHSSTFPKNYNYTLYANTNILKLNYIFDDFDFSRSKLVDDFANEFIKNCKSCPSRSKRKVSGNQMCYSCQKNKICFFDKNIFNKTDNRKKLSLYLAYPFPLTIEGTILYWADEIACFCRDILDFCCFVKLFDSKNINPLIVLSCIKSKILLLETNFKNNDLLKKVKSCFDLLTKKYKDKRDFVITYRKMIIGKNPGSLLNVLIESICPSGLNDNDVHVLYNGEECSPLFSFDPNTNKVFKELKKAIYEDMHNISYINNTNKVGKAIVDFIINYFLNNLSFFIKSYKQRSKHKKDDICYNLAMATMSILGMSKLERHKNKRSFKEMYSKWSIKISNEKSLLLNPLFASFAKHRNKDPKLVLNLIKREIGYFVATLSEKEIFGLLNIISKTDESIKKIIDKINEFPTKYIS